MWALRRAYPCRHPGFTLSILPYFAHRFPQPVYLGLGVVYVKGDAQTSTPGCQPDVSRLQFRRPPICAFDADKCNSRGSTRLAARDYIESVFCKHLSKTRSQPFYSIGDPVHSHSLKQCDRCSEREDTWKGRMSHLVPFAGKGQIESVVFQEIRH